MNIAIENLVFQEEKLFLEFKSEWYWSNNEKANDEQWGEFLKDFVALVNGNEHLIGQSRYLIIGVDESKTDREERIKNTDLTSKVSERFRSLNNIKSIIDEKINNFFKIDRNNDSTEEHINIDYSITYETVEKKQIVLFEINQFPYLLVLKKGLKDKNRTEKPNAVFIRSTKNSGDPEVINASPESTRAINNELNLYRKTKRNELDLTKCVTKTVSAYLDQNNSFKIKKEKKEKKQERIIYEFYLIDQGFTNIEIIYIHSTTALTKTYEYLLGNEISKKENLRIILIDDYLGRNIEQIKTKFSAIEVLSLEDFALKHLYRNQLEEDGIYYDGDFAKQDQIKNFVEPYSKTSLEKNALILAKEWFKEKNAPLLVIKGNGGFGKTTLAKNFLNDLWKTYRSSHSLYLLFIDSKEIISEIAKEGKIDDLFSFYKAYVDKYNVSKQFDRRLLELSVDNGKLLIVIDGIDEVIAKLGNKLDIKLFINNIYNMYLSGYRKTKVLITCRDYFWDKEIDNNSDIKTLEILPFTEELARKFFLKEFEEDSKEFSRCLENARDFTLHENGLNGEKFNIYIPYILDII